MSTPDNNKPIPRVYLLPRDDYKEYEYEAALAFARAWNNLDISFLEPLLDDESSYTSQNVFDTLQGSKSILDYLKAKFVTVNRHGKPSEIFAEIGRMAEIYVNRPCVIMAQGHIDRLLAVVLFETEKGRIKRIDMCSCLPNPSHATRTGQYPQ